MRVNDEDLEACGTDISLTCNRKTRLNILT